jgi:hypothetical protein
MCVAPRNLAGVLLSLTSMFFLACKDSTSPKTGRSRSLCPPWVKVEIAIGMATW